MRRAATNRIGLAVALLAVLGLAACGGGGDGDDIGCTTEARSGVGVTLRETHTDLPIEGATLTLSEGTYSEVLMEMGPGLYVGAWERAGVYELTVQAANYESAYRPDIVVLQGECHMIPAGLQIELDLK